MISYNFQMRTLYEFFPSNASFCITSYKYIALKATKIEFNTRTPVIKIVYPSKAMAEHNYGYVSPPINTSGSVCD